MDSNDRDPAAAGSSPIRVVIAGGGTGGHLYPGIAVAREFVRRNPDARITFAGTARGLETRIVPHEGFALDLIRSAGLKGKSIGARLQGVALLPVSGLDAWRVVSRRTPDLVIGVGGYSSGAMVVVAALRRVPTLLLEQNAVPGLTNRLLAHVVTAAAVTYERSLAWFGSRGFVAGNPVRPGFLADGGEPARTADVRRLLVFGGSQGAHAINVAMTEAAAALATLRDRLHVTHQAGGRDVDLVRDAYRRAGIEATVVPFLYAMDREMQMADLVVCRAGATTIAEITAAGRPAIVVPLAQATDDHQRLNAEELARAGAAEVITEPALTGAALADRIHALLDDDTRRGTMARAARHLARPEAARVIVDRAMQLIEAARARQTAF